MLDSLSHVCSRGHFIFLLWEKFSESLAIWTIVNFGQFVDSIFVSSVPGNQQLAQCSVSLSSYLFLSSFFSSCLLFSFLFTWILIHKFNRRKCVDRLKNLSPKKLEQLKKNPQASIDQAGKIKMTTKFLKIGAHKPSSHYIFVACVQLCL